MTPRQAEKLAALEKRLVIAFDNDGPGEAGGRAAYAALRKLTEKVEFARVPERCHDIGEMFADEVAQWVQSFAP